MTTGMDRTSLLRTDYRPVLVGQRFAIVPPDTAAGDGGDRLPLLMARGAFGSGEHETTQSCLEILEDLTVTDHPRILDLGSGTGILTIAAMQLFPGGHAWCVDIEQTAVISAQHNCTLNQIQGITHHCGTLETLPETGFNLILANIYGDILLDVAEDLVQRATSGAIILLSGILWEYNFDIRTRYQQLGCKILKNRFMEEFSTVLLSTA